MNTLLAKITDWFKSNCNGDWEHQYGVKIETLDNPGWIVKIDLIDTGLDGATFNKEVTKGEDDWVNIKIEDGVFVGVGDWNKLESILEIFLSEFLPTHINSAKYYEIYAPVVNSEKPLWRPVHAKMINENLFEIINIPDYSWSELKALDIKDFETLDKNATYLINNYNTGDLVKCDLVRMFDDPLPVIIQ